MFLCPFNLDQYKFVRFLRLLAGFLQERKWGSM